QRLQAGAGVAAALPAGVGAHVEDVAVQAGEARRARSVLVAGAGGAADDTEVGVVDDEGGEALGVAEAAREPLLGGRAPWRVRAAGGSAHRVEHERAQAHQRDGVVRLGPAYGDW